MCGFQVGLLGQAQRGGDGRSPCAKLSFIEAKKTINNRYYTPTTTDRYITAM